MTWRIRCLWRRGNVWSNLAASQLCLFCANSVWQHNFVLVLPFVLCSGLLWYFTFSWKSPWFSWSPRWWCRENGKRVMFVAKIDTTQTLTIQGTVFVGVRFFKLLPREVWGGAISGSQYWNKTSYFSSILLKLFSLQIQKEKARPCSPPMVDQSRVDLMYYLWGCWVRCILQVNYGLHTLDTVPLCS